MVSDYILDPSPDEWFDERRRSVVVSEILPCIDLLDGANLLSQVVQYFIYRECLASSNQSNHLVWARKTWGHRLDQLYLENKNYLDQVSYRLLRVSDQALALEIYHRLLAGENTFEEVSIKFGEGNEKFNGGFFKSINLEDLPNGIVHFLRNIEVGQMTKPLSMNGKFGIIQLVDFQPAVRGDAMDKRLLERQFGFWMKGMATHLCDHLKSNHSEAKL